MDQDQRLRQLEAVAEAVRDEKFMDAMRLVAVLDGEAPSEDDHRLMEMYEEFAFLRTTGPGR